MQDTEPENWASQWEGSYLHSESFERLGLVGIRQNGSASVSSAKATLMAGPPNQSFERTGLGARGSLRSVSVIVARRSTQIR